jgi:hypothetical protein
LVIEAIVPNGVPDNVVRTLERLISEMVCPA